MTHWLKWYHWLSIGNIFSNILDRKFNLTSFKEEVGLVFGYALERS